MELVRDFPPNFDKIDKAFGIGSRKGVYYAYGDYIYSPHNDTIPDELRAHEHIHGVQQMRTPPEDWWDMYIENPAFRLAQEIPAHREELTFLCANGNRNQRRRALKTVVRRLSSTFYGKIITPGEAKRVLRDGL